MPRWDFNLTVTNETDRSLELISKSVAWGDISSPQASIAKGKNATYNIYVPGGIAHGYEFTLVFQDAAPEGGEHYGTLTVYVDVPLTKDNHSSIQATGLLETSGWDGSLPKSGHDFAKTLVVSKKRI
ncbi:MAG: hypothetical protein LBL86_01525 [Coriobacteriales bacterium]|jgi:hypothetical protein|nr:hypothetical protein [Coriobacteriales bacterium]